jgi:hypothetical protein
MPPADDKRFDSLPIEYECASFVLKDASGVLPRRGGVRYGHRIISTIDEIIVHQTQGSTKPPVRQALLNEAEFFIAPDDPATPDVEGRGFPGFAYTFWIPFKPEITQNGAPIIYRCQPDEVISYHTGKHGDIVGRNSVGVAIAFQGLFRSRTSREAPNPSWQQTALFRGLLDYLFSRYTLTPLDLFGHCDFGKEDCPGFDLEARIDDVRSEYVRRLKLVSLDNWRERQAALATAGFLRTTEVDGDYGPITRKAVERLQHAHGYPVTGLWSRPVDTFIRRLVAEHKETAA